MGWASNIMGNFMNRNSYYLLGIVLLAILAFLPIRVAGHAVGENYVFLSVESEQLSGRFEFSYEDLETILEVEFDDEDFEKSRELAIANEDRLRKYISDHFELQGDGQPLVLSYGETTLLGDLILPEGDSDGGAQAQGDGRVSIPLVDPDSSPEGSELELWRWVQCHFTVPWDVIPDELTLDHRMLYDGDRFHRALLVVSGNEKIGEEYSEEHVVCVFGRHSTEQTIDLNQSLPSILTPNDFLWQGVLHIWIGIDHILFLAVLLLPAVLGRKNGEWRPVDRFGQGLWNVIKIVTVFTLAHSITLALAALDLVRVPSAFVESVIAASIVVVALNNIWPKVRLGSLWVILGFGLFHGLGFASVMGELPFRMMHLKKIILLFNLGVELGQLAIVAVVFSVLFLLRKFTWYRPLILVGGSGAAALVAAFWFVERAFGL